jgi:hypothetical protein
MKSFTPLLLLLLCAATALAQVPGNPPRTVVRPLQQQPAPQPGVTVPGLDGFVVDEGPKLSRFDLNFPGGTPHEFVTALDQALGKQVNVIIVESAAKVRLPPVRVRNATLVDVFMAIAAATQREVSVPVSTARGSGGPQTQSFQTRTVQSQFLPVASNNPFSDDTVWSFVSNEPETLERNELARKPVRELRHFQLRDYLTDKQTVEDITTAIRTGWQMLGVDEPPELKFHPETGILIAAGEQGLLEQIPMVLQQLPRIDDRSMPRIPKRPSVGAPGQPAPPTLANPPKPAAPAAPAKPAAPAAPVEPVSPEIPKPADNN